MKKVRFLFLILALILVVGMTTGLIVRKQSGGQSVVKHSSSVAATEAASTEAPVTDVTRKIRVLVQTDNPDSTVASASQYHSVVVYEGEDVADPIDTVTLSAACVDWTYDVYLVTPGVSSVFFPATNLRTALPYWHIYSPVDYSGTDCIFSTVLNDSSDFTYNIPANCQFLMVCADMSY